MQKPDDLNTWASKLDVDQVGGWSTNDSLQGKEKKFVYDVAKKLRSKAHLSRRQLDWLWEIHTKITRAKESAHSSDENDFLSSDKEESGIANTKHLCLRLAWHDSAWNGRVCKSPADNVYCVGEHSLLSDRIRRRRDLEIECQSGCAGCVPDMKQQNGYMPPCFWSINAFGAEHLHFEHDNPVAADFPHIAQELPPYSVISWPFKLAFVKDKSEKDKYGSYYPKAIFEKRIKKFQSALVEHESIVFMYCKYSNPVSGEDMQYLVTGCALLSEKEPMKWFDISDEQLKQTAEKLRQPNFPSLNWALRYSTDFENYGVRIPYHEYLELANATGGISEDLIKEIAVTIDEPELSEGFAYVAKHLDDDQSIYLLMKMRRSLLKIQGHDLLDSFDSKKAIETIDSLLDHAWIKRGYFPGLKNLLLSIPEVEASYSADVVKLLEALDCADPEAFDLVVSAIESGETDIAQNIEGLLEEVQGFLDAEDLSATDLLRLASLTLTKHQFRRTAEIGCKGSSLKAISQNLYLLFEKYEPDEENEDRLYGEKIDDFIDLFKIDIAYFPHAKYLKKIGKFHTLEVSDPRRLRAVILDVLTKRESSGDCYLEASIIRQEVENYPLFYKSHSELVVKEDLSHPSEELERHLVERVVLRDLHGVRVYYLKEIYDDEQYIADIIHKLLEKPVFEISTDILTSDIEAAAAKLKAQIGESFDAEQFLKERVELYSGILNQRVYVLTGSPGSGKSYELLKIIQELNKKSELTRVLTLTGKAALRLRKNNEGFEGINASTIDKFLIETDRATQQNGSVITDNLVIDEASMVDLPKLAQLLRAVDTANAKFKRLILVGDENQLPPIGFGKPFADIIDFMSRNRHLYAKNMICLDTNCRASLPNEYIEFSKAFSGISKMSERTLTSVSGEGSYFVGGLELKRWKNREDLNAALDASTREMIARSPSDIKDIASLLGIRSGKGNRPEYLDRFQILTPNRTGFFGASGLNLHYQDSVQREYLPGKIGEIVFKLHDKVMHTRNEYQKNELFVSNGSMGAIVGNQTIYFEEHDAPINAKKLQNRDQLELAYAITVHKSQGSGFDNVFIVLPEHSKFVSRELFYTALTRTKKRVVLFLRQNDDSPSIGRFFESVQKNSAIMNRRSTLLTHDESDFAYVPIEGVTVRSRVEYIVYRKLLEARKQNGGFSFQFEETYKVDGEDFCLHPDFVIRFDDGRVIYWEHLGKITSASYLRGWDDRVKIYRKQGDYANVMTTHELMGISDQKIEAIIGALINNNLVSEDSSNRYSDFHLSLR